MNTTKFFTLLRESFFVQPQKENKTKAQNININKIIKKHFLYETFLYKVSIYINGLSVVNLSIYWGT